MPRGDKHGGARRVTRPNDGRVGNERAGRKRLYHTIRIPAPLAPSLLNWLAQQRASLDPMSKECKAIDQIIAALWSDGVQADDPDPHDPAKLG